LGKIGANVPVMVNEKERGPMTARAPDAAQIYNSDNDLLLYSS